MGPGTMSARVGANIRRYRTERGITQERLVELLTEAGLEMSDAALSRLETGQRAVTVDYLSAFAEALDCAPADLLELPEERSTTLTLDHRAEVERTPGSLSPDLLRMLASIAVVTPETQATLDRIMATATASAQAIIVQHVGPLMDAVAQTTRGLPSRDANG